MATRKSSFAAYYKLSGVIAVMLMTFIYYGGFWSAYYALTSTGKYTVYNPDKQYYLEVYRRMLLFAMPGGGRDQSAAIILRNKDNKIIGIVSPSSDCSVMYRDVEIKWRQDYVSYSRGQGIDFKSGLTCP